MRQKRMAIAIDAAISLGPVDRLANLRAKISHESWLPDTLCNPSKGTGLTGPDFVTCWRGRSALTH